jgi:hypothetical protein
MGKTISKAVAMGGRAGHSFTGRAALSIANLSGATIFRSRLGFARSSIFFVLGFGFMAQGMFGAAVGNVGIAVM